MGSVRGPGDLRQRLVEARPPARGAGAVELERLEQAFERLLAQRGRPTASLRQEEVAVAAR